MDKELVGFIKAIGEPTRLLMLNQLKSSCCVGDVWKRQGLSQNLVSHHLRVLREAGLITAEKKGLKVLYCIDKKQVAARLKQLGLYLK